MRVWLDILSVFISSSHLLSFSYHHLKRCLAVISQGVEGNLSAQLSSATSV